MNTNSTYSTNTIENVEIEYLYKQFGCAITSKVTGVHKQSIHNRMKRRGVKCPTREQIDCNLAAAIKTASAMNVNY